MAGGRFGREHDGIGPVQHGVGHIQHLGPGRHGAGEHGLHHLGRRDHRPTEQAATLDQRLLHARQPGIPNFDPEISPGHHDDVGGMNDLVHGLDGGDHLGPLHLGDDGRPAAGGADQLTSLLQVRRAAREGDGHEIGVNLPGKENIGSVLVGQGRCAQAAAEHIDPLATGQGATDQHPGVHLSPRNPLHPELQATVIEQQYVADPDLRHQCRIVEPDSLLVALCGIQICVQDEAVSRLQLNAARRQAGDPDLGALQVGQYADVQPEPAGDLADPPCDLPVLLVAAVGEVEAKDIGAREQQLLHHLAGGAGRAQGGDNLGFTHGVTLLGSAGNKKGGQATTFFASRHQ
ncbi:hypothetical protein D3C71_1111770 [compost metagenome]